MRITEDVFIYISQNYFENHCFEQVGLLTYRTHRDIIIIIRGLY